MLEITSEGSLSINGSTLTRSATQEDSTASTIEDLTADFNSLLAKLKAAGLMG